LQNLVYNIKQYQTRMYLCSISDNYVDEFQQQQQQQHTNKKQLNIEKLNLHQLWDNSF